MTSMNRFEIASGDDEKLGVLLKRISAIRAGVPLPGDPRDAAITNTLPKIKDATAWYEEVSLKDFVGMLTAWGVQPSKIPDGEFEIKTVRVLYGEKQTLNVKIPAHEHIRQSEEFLNTGRYPMRPFYFRIYQKHPDIDDPMTFHCERIGEYTMSNCA